MYIQFLSSKACLLLVRQWSAERVVATEDWPISGARTQTHQYNKSGQDALWLLCYYILSSTQRCWLQMYVYCNPSGILKVQIHYIDSQVPKQKPWWRTVLLIWLPVNTAIVKVLSKCYLHLNIKQRWQQWISIPVSSLSASPSALQNLLPSLPEREAERLMCRCLRQIGTVVLSRCWCRVYVHVWLCVFECACRFGAVD